MQRVSALLPLWEKSKPASTGSSRDSASTDVPSHGNGHGSISNRSSSNRYSSNGSVNGSVNSNSNANANGHRKNERSISKVFSWADRIGVGKSLTISPKIANAGPASPRFPPSTGNSVSRETYWPTTLDRECDKAARILKSFCTDGFIDESTDPMPTSPTSRGSITSLTSSRFRSTRPADALPVSPTSSVAAARKKIPPRIIQDAVGLAIFSCVRSGLWMSGSGGSGILIARKADGTWSPPSGILLHTSTLAFVIGVDIYDCVLVINSFPVLELFTRSRLTLGVDVPLTVGPLAPLGLLENDERWNSDSDMANTVLTYLKARGRHRPAHLYGSFVTERSNENERFYSDDSSAGSVPIDILDILAGNIRKAVPETLPLFEAIKAAEGRIDFDTSVMERLSQQPAPGDADICETPGLLSPSSPKSTTFGVPDVSDPDPFGIIALEMAGLEIREAGSKHRPVSNQYEYNPTPASPIFPVFANRQSADAAMEHVNRTSYMSTRTQATTMTDACTQTDVADTPSTSPSPSHTDDGHDVPASMSRNIPSPFPQLVLSTPPPLPKRSDRTTMDAPADLQDASRVTTTRNSQASDLDDVTERVSTKFLMVDQATMAGDQSDVGTETATVTSSYYVDDERDQDADDEDEETDGYSHVTGDDQDGDDLNDDDDDDIDDDDEEPVIFEVATTASQPIRAVPRQIAQVVQAKGALVTIPKRVPPPLPLRSPARRSRSSKSEYGDLSVVHAALDGAGRAATPSFEDTEQVRAAPILDAKDTEVTEGAESMVAAKEMEGPEKSEQAFGAVEIENIRTSAFSSPSIHGTADVEPADKEMSTNAVHVPAVTLTSADCVTLSADESERELRTPRPLDAAENALRNDIPGSVDSQDSGPVVVKTKDKISDVKTDDIDNSSIIAVA